jgi:hypothetical protein
MKPRFPMQTTDRIQGLKAEATNLEREIAEITERLNWLKVQIATLGDTQNAQPISPDDDIGSMPIFAPVVKMRIDPNEENSSASRN